MSAMAGMACDRMVSTLQPASLVWVSMLGGAVGLAAAVRAALESAGVTLAAFAP